MSTDTPIAPTRTEVSAHPWWKTSVIYQIYPRSFRDADGDGIGDLAGIIQQLDYLAGGEDSLGVDAIWLSPVHPSPQKDFGYDVSDYRGIDPLFGDLEVFRKLLEEAHGRGLKVLMDLVVNHTSDMHPWFRESRSSRRNPRRDWYIWRDGKGKKPPNNWTSVFGGSAWSFDEVTGQYYLHSFLPEQPDLNWRNPEVQQAVLDIMRYWLEMGVDGFRLDVFNAYVKDADLRDNPRRLSGLGLFYGYKGQRHLRDRDQPEMLDILRRMRELVDSYPDRVMVGELLAEESCDKAVEYYGQADDGLHLVFNFDLLRSDWKPAAIEGAILDWASSLPSWAWPTWVMSNHDSVRHISRYKAAGDPRARAKVAAALLLCLRGTPFLYYGEELGLPEVKLSRSQIQDPPGKRYWPVFKGRDGCRTPMPWSGADHGGFSEVKPWLPLHPRLDELNLDAQRQDPDSIWRAYQALLALRKAHVALQYGSFHVLAVDDERVFAFRREVWPEGSEASSREIVTRWDEAIHPVDQVWVFCNLSDQVVRLQQAEGATLSTLFSTHRGAGSPLPVGTLWLFPYEVILAVPEPQAP